MVYLCSKYSWLQVNFNVPAKFLLYVRLKG